jgi:serine/threonine protein kinase
MIFSLFLNQFNLFTGLQVASQTMDAMTALHKMNIYHRDLKSSNLMIVNTKDVPGVFDLIDKVVRFLIFTLKINLNINPSIFRNLSTTDCPNSSFAAVDWT